MSVAKVAGGVDLASLLGVAVVLAAWGAGIEVLASSTSPSSTSATVSGLGVEAPREL